MRLTRFIIVVGIITLTSLIYLYQETEVIRLAYVTSKKSVSYQDLLEQNKNLRYNIDTLKSVCYLGNKVLARNTNFEIPKPTQLAELRINNKKAKIFAAAKKPNLILTFFSLKSQAEAQTTK